MSEKARARSRRFYRDYQSVHISRSTCADLQPYADRRGVTVQALIRSLVECIVLDDLVDAVLEDMSGMSRVKRGVIQVRGAQTVAVSVNDACKALGIKRTTANELIRSGGLKSVKVRGRRLVPVAALNELVGGAA